MLQGVAVTPSNAESYSTQQELLKVEEKKLKNEFGANSVIK
jgi:hypothetical protein